MCHQGFTGGDGWSAIAIALVARRLAGGGMNYRREAPSLAAAAVLFAALETGLNAVIMNAGFNIESTLLIQACVLFAVVARFRRPHARTI
jgi:simple sugar transport system permease protein